MAQHALELFTLASAVSMGAIGVYVAEDYGSLVANENVRFESGGDRLTGTFGVTINALSASTIALGVTSMAAIAWDMMSGRGKSASSPGRTVAAGGKWTVERVTAMMIFLVIVLAVGTAAVNLYITESFTRLDGLVDGSGDDAKLHGTWGYTMVSLNGVVGSLGLISMVLMAYVLMRKQGKKSEAYGGDMLVDLDTL